MAGVVAVGQANVVRLHSSQQLQQDLQVEGVFTCWYCRTDIPFTGQIFGRVGLGGALITLGCPKCHARIWTGFSSHLTAEGTDIYLYAPSSSRSGGDSALTPSFRINQVSAAPVSLSTRTEEDRITKLLPEFEQAVSQKAPYQEASSLAARLVGQPLSAWQTEDACRRLQALLKKESTTYLRAVLVEALACLRDERAVRDVRSALWQTLEREDPGDSTNLPLHDLCVLSLLFGDGNGFLEAMKRGMEDLAITTRACKQGKRLTPKGIARLIREENHIDSYESTLGGNNWQQVHPLLPLWVDDDETKKTEKRGWLNRLFKSS
jgi:hypothetical protein